MRVATRGLFGIGFMHLTHDAFSLAPLTQGHGMKVELRYFSGTGNSRRIIDTCRGVFVQNGCDVTLGAITDKPTIETDADLIGFCFPVHAFAIPRICRKYLLALPDFHRRVPTFVLVTAGSADEAGFSLNESSRILEAKGLKVQLSHVIHMPNNWTVSMNPPPREEAVMIIRSGVAQAEDIAQKILDEAEHHHPFNYPPEYTRFRFYKDFYLYRLLGVANLWRNFRTDETCNACGLCEKICPTGSILMADDTPVWSKTCEQCMRCVNYCPKQAIYQKGEGSIKGRNIYHEPGFKPRGKQD